MLTNCTVLDLTDEKGSFCAKLLADLGAEVIHIQPPGTETPSTYASTGKHNLSLNIEAPRGRELLVRLIKTADILIESFPPGFPDSLGLSYSSLSKINKRLIMASITDFGQSGPYRDKKSSDLVASALGGQAYINGQPGQPPLKPFGAQPYFTAGLFAANGIMLALLGRHNSGKGQYLDISIQECVAATLDHVLVRYFYQDIIAERTGSLYWNQAFRIFPCRDGYILLSFLQHWETLVDILDSEDLVGDLKDSRWSDEAERRRNIDHISQIIQSWTLQHNVDELVEMGQLMRFPWAKVNSIPEVIANPQLNDRGFFVEAADPASGRKYSFPGAPVKMSGSPWQVNPQIAAPGEYNYEIFHNRLGLSETEISSLASEGII